MSPPTFKMPACWRHFFKGHRWWCRACDRETESQFREVCEAWWASQTVETADDVVGDEEPPRTRAGWRPPGEGT